MTTYTITEAQRQQFLCAVMSKTDDQCAYAAHDLQSLQPNTQEPVGWLIDGLDVVMSYACAKAEQAEHHAMGGTAVAYPIYTHPAPQQKLLTNEQISTIQRSEPAFRANSCVAFTRAIEAAHNIKGNT